MTKLVCNFAIAILLQATAPGKAQTPSVAVDLCQVFVAPAAYNQKAISIQGVLFPSIHSLFLLSPFCPQAQNSDTSTQAILPPSWESLPNGKQLRKLLRHHVSANARLVGKFEAGPDRYGPDGARFQFVISEILSVQLAAPGIHS